MTRQEQVNALRKQLAFMVSGMTEQSETISINLKAASEQISPECREAMSEVVSILDRSSKQVQGLVVWLTVFENAPQQVDYIDPLNLHQLSESGE